MVPADEKIFVCSQPAAIVNNASLVCNVIDMQGFRFLRVEVFLGATDIALTALKLQESDIKASATALTGGADIVDSVFGTANQEGGVVSVLPSATDDNKVYSFDMDMRGRKRYVLPVVTIGNGSTGAYTTVVARLSRGESIPTTAAQRGLAEVVRIPNL